MENFMTYFISVAAGITVAALAKPLWLLTSGLARMVISDLPKISGRWKTQFVEAAEDGTFEESIVLYQLGRLVWGEGTGKDIYGRIFKYRGHILRNTLHGTYHRKKSNVPAGTGTFQLQIAGDDKSMNGWCLWYDIDTRQIEASPYSWKKQKS